jgi:hypothetical protein
MRRSNILKSEKAMKTTMSALAAVALVAATDVRAQESKVPDEIDWLVAVRRRAILMRPKGQRPLSHIARRRCELAGTMHFFR